MTWLASLLHAREGVQCKGLSRNIVCLLCSARVRRAYLGAVLGLVAGLELTLCAARAVATGRAAATASTGAARDAFARPPLPAETSMLAMRNSRTCAHVCSHMFKSGMRRSCNRKEGA